MHVECLSEVLTQEVRRTALQSLTVLHQSLDGQRIQRTCKALVGALMTHDYGHTHKVLSKILIDTDHLCCLLDSLLLGFVCSVSLLPQELGRAQEQTRTHLPTNNVCPLVAQNR